MKLLTPTGFAIDAAEKDVERLCKAGFSKPKAQTKAPVKKAQAKKKEA